MKKISILFCIALTFLTCKKSKEDFATEGLNGKWQMVLYGGFLPELPSIKKDDITWTFDLSKYTVKVVNKISAKYPYILKSGTYRITWTDKTIYLDHVNYDFKLKDNVLTLSYKPELDGPILQFNK